MNEGLGVFGVYLGMNKGWRVYPLVFSGCRHLYLGVQNEKFDGVEGTLV